MTIDIIRRILTDYFKYDVQFVMNVTDVDDKIIVKAREEKLFNDFKRSSTPQDARSATRDAFAQFLKKKFPEVNFNKESLVKDLESHYEGHVAALKAESKPLGDNEAKMKRDIKISSAAHLALQKDHLIGEIPSEFWTSTQDILKPFLDAKLGKTFDQDDHSPFNAISRKYEARFFEDMDQLNVRRPDILTRVTEYGEAIAQFVEGIVENGFAYEVDGSVYFDIESFEKAGRPYARLQPWNRGDKELQADGEGALSKGGPKRSDADFALWKRSKPGEPAWSSPWGKGRPGWHIECSAMASKELGQSIDVHSGGIDLAFPHHDNELAQSEAYWHSHSDSKHQCGGQWINYFVHMGHLHIGGHKMSKSLKNFTTIREELKTRSARTLRLIFLMGNWSSPIEVTDDMLKEVANWERTLTNFFLKVKDIERRQAASNMDRIDDSTIENSDTTARLDTALSKAQREVGEALADSFDTPRATRALIELVTQYNSSEKASLSSRSTLEVGRWVTKMINIFGLDATGPGAPDDNSQAIGWSGLDILEDIQADVYAISNFRDQLRSRANRILRERKNGPSTLDGTTISTFTAFIQPLLDDLQRSTKKSQPQISDVVKSITHTTSALLESNANITEYLKLCDTIRDSYLWDLSVYLEDSTEEGQPAVVRPLDAELIASRRDADQRKAAKLEQDKKKVDEKARKEAEADAKAKVAPEDMFKSDERRGEFGEWDEQGFPTRMADGTELTKNKAKGMRKEWELQRKRHEAWRAKQGQ